MDGCSGGCGWVAIVVVGVVFGWLWWFGGCDGGWVVVDVNKKL
jgi:hypothetical protein